jgi:Transposase DDE domain/SWIM zinc finger
MNPREERGLIIAATCRLNRLPDGTWLVPSQSKKSGNADSMYRVNLEAKSCTCPDHIEGGHTCKHYYAASIAFKRDVLPDGTVIETKTITLTERKTYKQDWPAYNLAQATEKRRVRVLLHDLCRRLPPRQRDNSGKRGRLPHHPSDAVFAMAYKVYCEFSARRFSTDLLEAHEKGFIGKPIPGMKATVFLKDSYYTPILKELIAFSASPLRSVEKDFAIDSSGCCRSRYEKWYDQKYGVTRTRAVWVKVHVASGVKTNVVTAVRIFDNELSADCPQFVPLVKETQRHFEISEVSADKAYVSVENFEEIAGCGAQAFIPFKSNTTGAVGGAFEKAYHYFQFNQEEFFQHYHKRSNVESTFSAIKRKFGDSVMSKNPTAMVNEVLCKILCHNLTCLIQEQETLGIAPVFWKDEEQEGGDRVVLPFAPLQRKSSTCND